MFTRRKLALCIALAAPAAVLAEPLNIRWVPTEARWVVHVDVEAATGSSLGRVAMAHKELWHSHCAKIKADTGIDPATDIKSLTVYGATGEEADAVAIIATTSATDSFLDSLRAKEATYKQIQSGKHTLDTWQEDGTSRYGFVSKVGDQRQILVSQNQGKLTAAIDLLEGSAPQAVSPVLAVAPARGSVLFVSASGVGEAAKHAKAVVVQKMQDFRLDVGEASGKLYGEMVVSTRNEQDAGDILKMMEGGISLGRMLAQSEPDLAPLVEIAQGIEFTTSGNSLKATISYDSQQAASILNAALEARRPTAPPAPSDKPDADTGPR
jgi:hypothetical protein